MTEIICNSNTHIYHIIHDPLQSLHCHSSGGRQAHDPSDLQGRGEVACDRGGVGNCVHKNERNRGGTDICIAWLFCFFLSLFKVIYYELAIMISVFIALFSVSNY